MDVARPQVRNRREGRMGNGKGGVRKKISNIAITTLFPLLSFSSTAFGYVQLTHCYHHLSTALGYSTDTHVRAPTSQ